MTTTSITTFATTVLSVLCLSGCTTSGTLVVEDQQGQQRQYCDVEFIGAPNVDRHAVEYALSLCAKDAVNKGMTIAAEDNYLLDLDLTIPKPPCGQKWHHELAEHDFRAEKISAKQYGYLVAHIDMKLAKVNRCDNRP